MATFNSIRAIEAVTELNNLMNMQPQRKTKTYKPREDPFVLYSETEFRYKYRFSKNGVIFLNQLIGNTLKMDTRGGGFTSIYQILIALRCWGRNQVQDDSADIHGLSQKSITNVCQRVARAILEKRNVYIKMPSSLQEELNIMHHFETFSGFKTVIGAIDCTHIRIPKVNGPIGQYYINRKGFSSLNVQVICDYNLKIRNIVAHWRGSTHDARIFNESSIKRQFEERQFHGRLLGDSGYACTPYLFTPLLNATTQREESYNYSHIRTRNVVERCFGVWKNRFLGLLSGFRTSLENTKMYIVALAVLHNIAIELNEELFNDDNEDLPQDASPLQTIPTQSTQRGAAARATFIDENF